MGRRRGAKERRGLAGQTGAVRNHRAGRAALLTVGDQHHVPQAALGERVIDPGLGLPRIQVPVVGIHEGVGDRGHAVGDHRNRVVGGVWCQVGQEGCVVEIILEAEGIGRPTVVDQLDRRSHGLEEAVELRQVDPDGVSRRG